MARQGHFWSLASLPLPLPRPLPEKHDMKRVSIKYSVRDPLLVPLVLNIELIVEISYLEIYSTSPNCKTSVLSKQRAKQIINLPKIRWKRAKLGLAARLEEQEPAQLGLAAGGRHGSARYRSCARAARTRARLGYAGARGAAMASGG
ncbi:hypothetical protein E6C27_scaffold69G00270 [Cucumis melo var. makuwa]|uniref:Uncharacterized protein n=1 Tax=Cucumis melo var. makuwa TaxID=1194695 RepID=A0A5A7T003_CUCMM|nr:hypothetical protein E6C27_scaffold69G00270 [Cucumis melo var. makuwa]